MNVNLKLLLIRLFVNGGAKEKIPPGLKSLGQDSGLLIDILRMQRRNRHYLHIASPPPVLSYLTKDIMNLI